MRALFEAPTPAGLAAAAGAGEWRCRRTGSRPGAAVITPEMLPLAELNGGADRRVVARG